MTSEMLRPGQSFGERYTLLTQLGAGGAGTVFKALDDIRCVEVGIKILRSHVASNETARVRFLREFRAIARLEHPNCLQVFEQGEWEGHHYYTMEYIEGGELASYRGASQVLLLELFSQIAVALAHIHNHRIVHRDLKPANLLVETQTDGSLVVKLADFGIAKLLDDQSMTNTGMMMGTVGYMSPEQIRGEEIDPRSDLYSLGCIIHDLLTGQPPFVHPKGPFEVLRGHLDVTAPRLSERVEDVQEGLDDLVARLLAKDPADRPGSALAVVDTLATLRDAEPSLQTRGPAFLYRPAMVGRVAQREALISELQRMFRAGAHRPKFATLCAPAGMGKSRLVDAVVKDLKVRGVQVLIASVESDPDALFSPFPEIERNLDAAEAASWDAETVSPEQGVASPTTIEVSPSALDPERARRQRAQTLARRIIELGASGPVALILEDLHWMKAGALEMLSDMLPDLSDEIVYPPALLLTTRPGPGRQAIEALSAGEPCVDLEPLDAQEVEALLGQMLGQAQDHTLLERLVRQVLAQTEGNPLFVQAYLQNVVEQQGLKRTREGWTLQLDANTGDLVPRTMAQVLGERLAMLAPETYNVLRGAAAVGRVFDYALLREVLDVQEGELLDALDEALRTWIIRSIPGPKHLDLYTFDHAKFIDALYEDMSPSRRRSLHQRIGVFLESRKETSPQILASHFARGEDPHRARKYQTQAGLEALAQHDHARALEHFDGALALLDGLTLEEVERHEARADLLESRADALGALGRHGDAAATLSQRLEHAPDLLERARLARKLARALYLDGRTQDGIDAFEKTLRALGDRTPGSRTSTLVRLVVMFLVSWMYRFLPAARGHSLALMRERALTHRDLMVLGYWLNLERSTYHQLVYLRLAERVSEPMMLVDAYSSHLVIVSMARQGRRFLRYRDRARAMADRVGDAVGLSRLSLFASVAYSFRADQERFKRHHVVAMEQADRAGDRFNLGFTMMTGGWSAMLVDEVAYARELFERNAQLGVSMSSERVEGDGLAGLGAIKVLCGEPIGEMADRVFEIGESLGVHANRALGRELQGASHYFLQEFDQAVTRFRQARDIYVENRLFGTWGFMIGYEFAEALLHAVDARDGVMTKAELGELHENIKISQLALKSLPPFRGFYETLLGTYEARRGKTSRALKLFERAETYRAAYPAHYLTGWVYQRIAIERARLGQPREEIDALLTRYDAIFEDSPILGLKAWIRVARGLMET